MKNVILFLTISIILCSCKKCPPDPKPESFHNAELYANYENPPEGTPSLTVIEDKSTSYINIEALPVITNSDNGRLLFNYSAVTFKEGKDVYVIDSVVTQKYINDWIKDEENFLDYDNSKSLDIAIVLDVSSSLKENITKIKENAKNVISNILETNSEARIAVLKFSRGSIAHELTSSASDLSSFIDANSTFQAPDIVNEYILEGRDETALYETINAAIELLNNTNARGKGILTFTDGVSNFQFDPQHSNATAIIYKLKNSHISSYTIGYIGNENTVDKTTLQNIAINGDYSFPENLSDLNQVFIKFSNSVAAVYDLTYNTNNAKFIGEQQYRFLFKTRKISE